MLWNDRYRVGVPELDSQYVILFTLANHLKAAAEAQVSVEVANDLLRGVRDFANFHLRAEKVIMEQQGYPDVMEHSVEHHRVMDELEALVLRPSVDSLQRAYSVVSTLFEEHSLREDRDFARFLEQRRSGNAM